MSNAEQNATTTSTQIEEVKTKEHDVNYLDDESKAKVSFIEIN